MKSKLVVLCVISFLLAACLPDIKSIPTKVKGEALEVATQAAEIAKTDVNKAKAFAATKEVELKTKAAGLDNPKATATVTALGPTLTLPPTPSIQPTGTGTPGVAELLLGKVRGMGKLKVNETALNFEITSQTGSEWALIPKDVIVKFTGNCYLEADTAGIPIDSFLMGKTLYIVKPKTEVKCEIISFTVNKSISDTISTQAKKVAGEYLKARYIAQGAYMKGERALQKKISELIAPFSIGFMSVFLAPTASP